MKTHIFRTAIGFAFLLIAIITIGCDRTENPVIDGSSNQGVSVQSIAAAPMMQTDLSPIRPVAKVKAEALEKNSAKTKNEFVEDAAEIGPLFRIELAFQKELDNRRISEELFGVFEKNGYPLSKKAIVSIEENFVQWLITYSEQKYTIKKGKDYLDVYKISGIKQSTQGNRQPIITSPGNGNRGDNEGDVVSFYVMATDPDGDSLTYSIFNPPPGIGLHPTTGHVSGTIGAWVPGDNPYHVSISVSDGQLSDVRVIVWTVVPAPPTPPTPQVPDTIFQNNSSYPLLNLEVDGQGYLNADLQPGDSISINLAQGAHTVHAAAHSSVNIYNRALSVYVWDFTVQAGATIEFINPPITDVLSNYGNRATWVGYYNVNIPMRFEFYNNGTFEVFDNNQFLASGTYHQVSENPFDISRQFRINPTNPPDPGNEGYLYEAELKFIMDIGPGNSPVEFRPQ